eukprot:Gb_20823 [translate_table: standard]
MLPFFTRLFRFAEILLRPC